MYQTTTITHSSIYPAVIRLVYKLTQSTTTTRIRQLLQLLLHTVVSTLQWSTSSTIWLSQQLQQLSVIRQLLQLLQHTVVVPCSDLPHQPADSVDRASVLSCGSWVTVSSPTLPVPLFPCGCWRDDQTQTVLLSASWQHFTPTQLSWYHVYLVIHKTLKHTVLVRCAPVCLCVCAQRTGQSEQLTRKPSWR